MQVKTFEIKWRLVGAKLANLDDSDQAEFFKGLAMEFRNWDSTYKAQVQAHSIADMLSDKDKKLLKLILSCLWMEDE